jgi:hypothetical protein
VLGVVERPWVAELVAVELGVVDIRIVVGVAGCLVLVAELGLVPVGLESVQVVDSYCTVEVVERLASVAGSELEEVVDIRIVVGVAERLALVVESGLEEGEVELGVVDIRIVVGVAERLALAVESGSVLVGLALEVVQVVDTRLGDYRCHSIRCFVPVGKRVVAVDSVGLEAAAGAKASAVGLWVLGWEPEEEAVVVVGMAVEATVRVVALERVELAEKERLVERGVGSPVLVVVLDRWLGVLRSVLASQSEGQWDGRSWWLEARWSKPIQLDACCAFQSLQR